MSSAPELTNQDTALLLACARARPDSCVHERIQALVRGPIQWTPLVDAAERHGVMPLLHASLSGIEPGLVPAAVAERIRAAARANVHHSLFLMAELVKLLALFENAGITAIPFKGPVLAAAAYGDVTLRQFTDLDLFVHKADLAALARLMLANGYLSATHDGGAATAHALAEDGDVAYRDPSYHTFYRADGRCRVDLQWRMADRHFAFSLDEDAAAWSFVGVPLAGRSIRTFSTTDTLLILCVHGSKHEWEMLKWICDIAECIAAQRDAIDWRALHSKAVRLRVWRMVAMGLALAHEVLDAPLPEDVSRRLDADRALAKLVSERRAALFMRDDPSRADLPRLKFYLRSKDGWRDQVRFCATYARQFGFRLVQPTEHDMGWVALPPRLEPLYYLLRPVRVLASYARRAPWPRRSTSPTDRPGRSQAAVSRGNRTHDL